MSKYKYDERGQVVCKLPNGADYIVATAIDPYWAEAIVHALNSTER